MGVEESTPYAACYPLIWIGKRIINRCHSFDVDYKWGPGTVPNMGTIAPIVGTIAGKFLSDSLFGKARRAPWENRHGHVRRQPQRV